MLKQGSTGLKHTYLHSTVQHVQCIHTKGHVFTRCASMYAVNTIIKIYEF